MTSPQSLSSQTPVEIDNLLLPIWLDMSRQYGIMQAADLDIQEATADIADAQAKIAADPESYDAKYHAAPAIERAETKITEAEARIIAAQAQMQVLLEQERPYQDEYNRRPWNRYYIVQNNNGHVHRGTSCSTCFPTTRYGWIVKLSGCDEEEMVNEFGEMACTVCFPDAPTYAGWAASIEAKAAAEAASRCTETWPIPSETTERWNGGYGNCKCGARGISLSSNGKLLKHLTPEQAQAEADRKATFGHPDGKKLKDCTGQRAQKTPKGAFNALREGLRIKAGFDAGTPHPYYVSKFKPAEITRLAEGLALYHGTTPEAQIALAEAKNIEDEEKETLRRMADVQRRLRRR